jgi:hypothetical protein
VRGSRRRHHPLIPGSIVVKHILQSGRCTRDTSGKWSVLLQAAFRCAVHTALDQGYFGFKKASSLDCTRYIAARKKYRWAYQGSPEVISSNDYYFAATQRYADWLYWAITTNHTQALNFPALSLWSHLHRESWSSVLENIDPSHP